MRIGIDGRFMSKQRTGIGNYVENLVQGLPLYLPQHKYFVYSNSRMDGLPGVANCESRVDKYFEHCPGGFWFRYRCPSLIRRDDADVFWSSYPILPANLPDRMLKVITVHDLVWLRFPETTSRYNLLVQRLWSEKAIKDADRIVAVSQTTRDAVVQQFGVPQEKMRLVYPGISERYRPQDHDASARYISQTYKVPTRYMATVCSVEPRKNLSLLVEALRILKSRGQVPCPLLVAGAKGWRNSALFDQVREARLTEDEIRFLGYLPTSDLPQFYGGAQVFLFPTLYEGFGLPPVEAMACGTPVIASNAPCMPEVLGEAAVLESPSDAESFAEAILRVLGDEKKRAELSASGVKQASKFSCHASVMALAAALTE